MMMMMDSFILQYEHHTDEDSQKGGSDGSYISAQLIYIRAMKEWAAYTYIREKKWNIFLCFSWALATHIKAY